MSKKQTKRKGKKQAEKSGGEGPEKQRQAESNPADDVSEQLQAVDSENKDTAGTKKAGAMAGAAKAIEEGAEYVGEKAPEVASVVFHTVKKGATVAYGAGSTIVREAYHAAREYAEIYKHKAEIRKLRTERKDLAAKLGSFIYTGIAVENQSPDKLLEDEQAHSLMQQIERLDNELVSAGQELEKH